MQEKSEESIESKNVKLKLKKTLETVESRSDSTDFGLEHAENLIAVKPPVLDTIDVGENSATVRSRSEPPIPDSDSSLEREDAVSIDDRNKKSLEKRVTINSALSSPFKSQASPIRSTHSKSFFSIFLSHNFYSGSYVVYDLQIFYFQHSLV